jgi:hypothetical protein
VPRTRRTAALGFSNAYLVSPERDASQRP